MHPGLPSDYLLAYDAGCGPCSRFKALVSFLDARGRLDYASLGEADKAGALAAVEPATRYSSFHLVSAGRDTWSGADALLPLVRVLLPGGEALTMALEGVPGFRRAIAFGYAALSRLHDSGSCGTAAR
jgi:predicted DCC family thiol-disulfide oxidoreductase YuxK